MPKTQRYDVVLLDADETIFDFKRAEAAALRRTLEDLGVAYNDERLALYSKINLSCWKALERGELSRERLKTLRFERFFSELGMENIDCSDVHEHYLSSFSESGYLLPGALEFVKKLHKYCKIYIATNGLIKAQTGRLDRSEVKHYIDGMYISEAMGTGKPSKEYFDAIFDDIGCRDKSRVIIIGDSLTSDMQGGRNAGIATCRYLGENVHEDSDLVDFEIRDYDEFFEILFDEG